MPLNVLARYDLFMTQTFEPDNNHEESQNDYRIDRFSGSLRYLTLGLNGDFDIVTRTQIARVAKRFGIAVAKAFRDDTPLTELDLTKHSQRLLAKNIKDQTQLVTLLASGIITDSKATDIAIGNIYLIPLTDINTVSPDKIFNNIILACNQNSGNENVHNLPDALSARIQEYLDTSAERFILFASGLNPAIDQDQDQELAEIPEFNPNLYMRFDEDAETVQLLIEKAPREMFVFLATSIAHNKYSDQNLGVLLSQCIQRDIEYNSELKSDLSFYDNFLRYLAIDQEIPDDEYLEIMKNVVNGLKAVVETPAIVMLPHSVYRASLLSRSLGERAQFVTSTLDKVTNSRLFEEAENNDFTLTDRQWAYEQLFGRQAGFDKEEFSQFLKIGQALTARGMEIDRIEMVTSGDHPIFKIKDGQDFVNILSSKNYGFSGEGADALAQYIADANAVGFSRYQPQPSSLTGDFQRLRDAITLASDQGRIERTQGIDQIFELLGATLNPDVLESVRRPQSRLPQFPSLMT